MLASAVSSNSSEVGLQEGKRSSSLPNTDLHSKWCVCVCVFGGGGGGGAAQDKLNRSRHMAVK